MSDATATMPEFALPRDLPLDARIPKQARSRARFARILQASRKLIAKHGVLGLKMHDIAASARIPVGSVYQYFPTRSALIAYLFALSLESYHRLGRRYLERVRTPRACAAALRRVVLEVYAENRADALMQEIWSGVQADPTIRTLHLWDNEEFTRYFYDAARRSGSPLPDRLLMMRCQVVNEMWDGTIRLSITLDPRSGEALVTESITIGVRALGLCAP